MSLLIILLLNIVQLVYSQLVVTIPIQTIQRGCQSGFDLTEPQSPCIKQCPLGQADCLSKQIICEYGYFLYTLNGFSECVKCPYQDYQDELTLFCMDCVENPYTWNRNRQCTYEYVITNGDKEQGVYQQQMSRSTSLFFVIDSTQKKTVAGQRTPPQKEVFLCEGCQQFCLAITDSTQCNLVMDFYMERGQEFVICKDGYYYNNSICLSCGDNCQQCAFDSYNGSYYCSVCEPQFALDPRNFICQPCFENCLDCYYGDDEYYDYSSTEYQEDYRNLYNKPKLQMYCYFCDRSDPDIYFISSLDQLSCESCIESCQRCEYVTYDDELTQYGELYQYPTRNNYTDDYIVKNKDKYVKRCRQCIDSDPIYDSLYFISYDGQTCSDCQIDNCAYCYQQVDENTFTFELDFKPNNDPYYYDTIFCYQCVDGYTLDENRNCVQNTLQVENCITYNQQLCTKCIDNYLLDLTQTSPNCNQKCNVYIDRCISCYMYIDQIITSTIYVCTECISGYYPDFFTGICLPCNSQQIDTSCQQCAQYSDGYNFTDYLQLRIQFDSYEKQKIQLNSGQIYQTQCIQCSENLNYDIYTQTCGNCGINCADCDEGYCIQCSKPNQKSLTSDKRDCLQCPLYCEACRERTSQEIKLMNPNFSPSLQDYWKYSRLCFLSQNGFYYDTQLGRSVLCDTTTTGMCKKSINLSVNLHCDDLDQSNETEYDLYKIFQKSKNEVVSITFDKLEVPDNYDLWNRQAISEMNLTINLVGSECNFSKSASLDFKIQQNVFSLKNFRIIINGLSQSQVKVNLKSQLYIKNVVDVKFNNLKFQQLDSNNNKNSVFNYGISLITDDLTSLSFENVDFGQNNSGLNQYQLLACNWSNIYKLSMVNVIFYQNYYNKSLSLVPFTIKYTVQNASIISYYFDNVQIFGFDLSNTNMFALSQISSDFQELIIGPNGFFIRNCQFYNTKIFSDYLNNGIQNININVQKIVVQNSNFTQSSIFDFQNAKTVNIQNCDLYQIQLLNQSYALFINQLQQITNLYSYQLNITNQSQVIKSIGQIQENIVSNWSLNNLNFQETICQTQNCIILMKDLLNINLKIVALQILNTNVTEMNETQISSVESALVKLQTLNDIQIIGFFSQNNFAIVVINIMEINRLKMENIFISQIDTNNLIPINMSCALNKYYRREYNSIQIFVQNFKMGVFLSGVEIKDLFLIDYSPIYIESYNPLIYNTSDVTEEGYENIVCQGCNFLRNRLLITDPNNQISLFQIVSRQIQQINLQNINFMDNYIHLLVPQTVFSTTCIQIQSVSSIVNIKSLQMISNVASYATKGLVYIVAQQINYDQVTCQNANIYDQQKFEEVFQPQFNEQNFQFLSEGTCGNFLTTNITINNSTFQYIQGKNGAGIYIQFNNIGLAQIINTWFLYITASLKQNDFSEGGCLYVDSKQSSLNLKLQDIVMVGCMARLNGGCIHIEQQMQRSLIEISDSYFYGCFALKYSFMDVIFSDYSQELQEVRLIEISIYSDNQMQNQFISSVPSIQDNELAYFINSSSVYYQRNGIFTLQNADLFDIDYTSLFVLENMNSITFTSVMISAIQLLVRPLIILQLKSSSQNSYYLTAIEIFDVTQFTQINNNNCSQKIEEIITQFNITDNTYNCMSLDNSNIEQFSTNIKSYNDLSISDKYQMNQSQQNIQDFKCPEQQPGVQNLQIIDVNFTNCIITNLISPFQNSDFSTSLITIQSVGKNQTLEISQVSIDMNSCDRCQGGLIQIFSVNPLEKMSRIMIQDLVCQNNQIGYFGCLQLSSYSNYDLINFGFNLTESSTKSQRILYKDTTLEDLQSEFHTVTIQNSYFYNNIAQVASCISIVGLKSFIYQSQFVKNTALQGIAAVYFKNTKNENKKGQDVQISFYKVDFQSNNAKVYGAVYLYDSSLNKEQEMEIMFVQNVATMFSPNLQEYAARLSIQILDGQNPLPLNRIYSCEDSKGFIPANCSKIIDEVVIRPYYVYNFINNSAPQVNKSLAHYFMMPSGQQISQYKFYYDKTKEYISLNYIFRIINLDRFNQKIGAKETDQCTVQARIRYKDSSNDSIPFKSQYIMQQNVYSYNAQGVSYNLDNLMIQFDPRISRDQFLQIQFKCTSVQIPIYNTTAPYNIQSYFKNYELWLNVQTFDCQVGEYYSQGKCIACIDGSGTYSLSNDYIQCKVMDQKTMKSVRSYQIQLKKGYWRPYDNIDSVSQCFNLLSNCKGGWNSGDDSCYIGHIGALCESCDITGQKYGESWATSGKSQCGKCADIIKSNVVIIVFISLFTLISMIFSVKSTREIVELQLKNQIRISIGSLVKENKSNYNIFLLNIIDNVAILIKILTNYFQIISAITSFQLSIPQSTQQGVETLGQPTKSMAVSYDCLFQQIAPMIQTLYFRMIWALIIPCFYLLIYLFGYFMAVLFKISPYRSIVIYTTFIYMFIYLQPTLIGGFIAIASSRKISDFYWVQADVSVRTDSPSHQLWSLLFVLPNILLWGLIFPCSWLYSLYKRRYSLKTKETLFKLGFFYNEYRIAVYYWEFVKIFQKELITIVLIFYDDYVSVKGLIVFFLIWGYGLLTLQEKPYNNKQLNKLDFYSASVCALTMSLGVLVNQTASFNIIYLTYIFLLIIALSNLWFLLQIVKVLILGFYEQFQDQLDLVRQKILQKNPEIVSKYPWMKPYVKIHKDVDQRTKYLWAQFRYKIRQNIKRKRIEKTVTLKMVKPEFSELPLINSEPNQSKLIEQDEQDKPLVFNPIINKIDPNPSKETDQFRIQDFDDQEKQPFNKQISKSSSNKSQVVKVYPKPKPDESPPKSKTVN